MKDLLVGVLAFAAGVYVEKKYNVSGKITEQVNKFSGKDLLEGEDQEPEFEVD